MGNQASALTDEPYGSRDLHHFDHAFKGSLHTTAGYLLTSIFGEIKYGDTPIQLICKGESFDIVDDGGLTSRKSVEIPYMQVNEIAWDHAHSEIKLGVNRDEEQNFVILTMANTIELEQELKLRFNSLAQQNRGMKVPFPMYIGMFAGATKPKPFQRKRPNLSTLAIGKLPPLHDMRGDALILHRGSYRPCPQGASRRVAIAMQHIHKGYNSFKLIDVRGPPVIVDRFRSNQAVLILTEDMIIYKPNGEFSDIGSVAYVFENVRDFNAIDNDKHRDGGSGIEIECHNGERVFFGVMYVRDVKHSLEFFWNKYQVNNGGQVKLASTHGRPLVTVSTLSGEVPPPERPIGSCEVVDQDGCLVRTGQRIIPRKKTMVEGFINSKPEITVVPPENREVKKFWHKVVVHQGWLLKKGGIGFGDAKNWIKRYFVLYSTSQGHFLIYYSDFTECPLYTQEINAQRNVVDLAKATFIRPGSKKAEESGTPPYSFDIVTTEREWTLCAESQENVQKWLRLITRAVDEDVAILPDEELNFKVKPKVDPLGVLPASDYSTTLKVSANGISVCTPDANNNSGGDREIYFWAYTDFYKWSLLTQNNKLALLLNVFADSSFSRRNEYIFRNPDSVRLATAIEYFIEKFMTVNHIRLELTPSAFDDQAEDEANGADDHRTGMHNMATSEWQGQDDEGQDQEGGDLLDLDSPTGAGPDLLGSSSSAPPPAPPATRAPAADPFGSSSDPFSSDPFSAPSSSSSSSLSSSAVAPPLSPAQLQQQSLWFLSALASSGGPLYDDGVVQIATKLEVRGSQGRLTFFFRNMAASPLQGFKLSVSDEAGFIRFELQAGPQGGLDAQSQGQQVMMFECMKPCPTGPQAKVEYLGPAGRRSASVDLPIFSATFNEPLVLTAADFSQRWEALAEPGKQLQEILSPSEDIVPANVAKGMVASLKFGRVTGMPDESEFVIYGASLLRTGAQGPNGEKINVGCLVKIEMNVQAKKLRVTARTVHPAATTALFACAKLLLC